MKERRRGTCIRFDRDVHDRLVIEAETRMVSITWIVNQLVREGLERIVPADEFVLTRSEAET